MGDLGRRVVRGGSATLGSQGVQFLVQLGSTAILARLLTPQDYGLVGMATVVMGFVGLMRDPGLSTSTIQRPQITHQQVSTLFWINVLLSSLIAAGIMACAPLIAWFFGEPRLVRVTMAIGLCSVLGGLNAQHHALLLRQMRFADLAKVDIVAKLFSAAVACAAAWAGWGYWSLVLLTASNMAYTTAACWWTSGWHPGMPKFDHEVKGFLKFGGNLMGFQLVNYLARNADNLLIGWYWGSGPLGLYAKAYQLLLLPMQQLVRPISRVTTPTLARVQHDPERYRQCYRNAVLPLVAMTAPIVAFATVEADNLVRVALGKQWVSAAVIFRWLAPAAFISASYVATGWVYVSMGRTDRQFKWGLFSSAMALIGFAVCLPFGLTAVAAGFSIITVLLRYPSVVYCLKGTPLRMSDAVQATWVPTMASLGAAAVCFGVQFLLPQMPPIVELAISGCLYSAAYVGLWMIPARGREQARLALDMVSAFRKSKKSAPAPAPVTTEGAGEGAGSVVPIAAAGVAVGADAMADSSEQGS